jgi:hypothetical protein
MSQKPSKTQDLHPLNMSSTNQSDRTVTQIHEV